MPRPQMNPRHRSRLPALLAVVGSLLSLAPAAQADTTPTARPAPVYTGNYIVRWRDGGQSLDTDASATRMKWVASNTGLSL